MTELLDALRVIRDKFLLSSNSAAAQQAADELDALIAQHTPKTKVDLSPLCGNTVGGSHE